MYYLGRILSLTLLSFCLFFSFSWDQKADAAEIKIATIDLKKVLGESDAGQTGQRKLQQKVEEFREKFESKRSEIEDLRESIAKKKSVWSEEVLKDKEREMEKIQREFRLKQEDAKYELEQLQERVMKPILKDLHGIIREYGEKHGFTVILDNTEKGLNSRSGLLYATDSIDISDEILKILDSKK
ncbi:MAG: OmpH family outer membrane protein [Thermodesulfobacteriota bacterium]